MMSRRIILALALTTLIAHAARAQSPRIISASADGWIFWTNATTNATCALEWTLDPNWEWDYMSEEIHPTSDVSGAQVPLASLFNPDLPISAALAEKAYKAHFFRVVSSSTRLSPHVFTNHVRIVNATTSHLTTLSLNTEPWFRPTLITNYDLLPPNASTEYSTCIDDWWWTFNHNGQSNKIGFLLFPWGPPLKNVTVTIGETGSSVFLEWLNETHTR